MSVYIEIWSINGEKARLRRRDEEVVLVGAEKDYLPRIQHQKQRGLSVDEVLCQELAD